MSTLWRPYICKVYWNKLFRSKESHFVSTWLRCRSTMTASNDRRRRWVDSRSVVRLVEQVLLHEQEMCFLRRAATVEMGNDRCVGVISPKLRKLRNKGNAARNPVLNLLRPLFRLYDEIGTTDKCTPQAKLMHVIIPTKKSHLSTKMTAHTSRWRIYLNFNENGAKVRACVGRDTAPSTMPFPTVLLSLSSV